MCVSRCVWSSVVVQLCVAWFRCGSVLDQVCVCLCVCVSVCLCVCVSFVCVRIQVYVDNCCGSVVRGMFQMWFSIGSVLVQVCVYWFRCVRSSVVVSGVWHGSNVVQ